MSTASGSDRPPRCSSSRQASKLAESLSCSASTGNRRSSPRPGARAWPSAAGGISALASMDSRARIQLRLPLIVLISPLCATNR